MKHLLTYPDYCDSGVEYLGEVPGHWNVRRLGEFGWFFKGNGGTRADETEIGVPCIRYGDLYTRHNFHIVKSKSCVEPSRAESYKSLRYGDILFAGSGETLDEIGKSAVNLIKGPVVCGGDVIVFRPTIELDAKFIGWSTDSRHATAQKALMGRGITVIHIYSKDIKCLAIPLPPLPEQTAIARYLDYATTRIRRYIEAKGKLLTLLEEQKRAVIHEAVTGSVDVRTGRPYPAYKDSGIEWIGKVPEHWEVRRLKSRVENIVSTTTERRASEIYLALEHVESWTGRVMVRDTDTPLSGQVKRFRVMDVLFGKLRPYLAKVVHSSECGVCVGEFLVLRSRRRDLNTEFLAQFLRSKTVIDTINRCTYGAKMPRVEWNVIGSLPWCFPTLAEQLAIAQYLHGATSTIERTIELTRRQIALSKEYRTRLISDVVTGKFDVREAAENLPETDPLAANSDPAETSPTDESKLHSTAPDMAKESVP